MMLAEHHRAASAVEGPPDLPPELFGGQAPQKLRQASASAMSPDAYLDFLCPPSPGRNAADLSLDSLWATPPQAVQAAEEDPLASLWTTPAPTQQASEPDLSSLWASTPSGTEPDLEGLWDSPGRATEASDAGDSLSGLFMTGEAVAQAEMTGQSFEAGEIPMPRMARTASSDFNIEFDGGMDFGAEAPSRASSAARFRVDQPPRYTAFQRGNITAQDGVVVGQRGSNGRFQRTAAAARPQMERPVPQPRPAPAPRVEAPRPQSTFTKYDILRKGGLDV
jgi:hypothetical protein